MLMLCAGLLAAPASGQETKLLAGDGAASDSFGGSVAIDSGIALVGAPTDDDNGSNSGAAYLFDATTGVQIAKLLPDDGAANDLFGWAVAIGDGIAAVGAYQDDDNGTDSGSVYLFDASTGVQIAKLLATDGAAFDHFGSALAIDNGIVAVGSRYHDQSGTNAGSAYLFNATTGVQTSKLVATDARAFHHFGSAVDIGDGVVVVGTPFDDDNGPNAGAAYVFDAGTGAQLAKLLPGDGTVDDQFGLSVAIDGGIVAVGAYGDADLGPITGSAYLFDAPTGVQTAKLIASDQDTDDAFGWSVNISAGVVIVGARFENALGTDSGSAYLFDAASGTQLAKLIPSDGAAADFFGQSVAIDGGIVVVGASADDDNGPNSGSAYAIAPDTDADGDGLTDVAEIGFWGTDPFSFDTDGDGITDEGEVNTLGTDPLLADTDADGVSDLLDKCHGGDDTLDADGDGIPDACDTAPACAVDINGDGVLDNGDIILFVQLFLAGC